MAWTAPRTWVALEIPSASVMNTHIRDNFEFLMPRASVGWQEVRSAGGGGSSLWVNGWTDYDLTGSWGPCRFRRVGFWAQLIGLANGASSTNAGMFTLPTEFWPLQNVNMGSGSDTGGGGTSPNDEQVPSIFVSSAGLVSTGGANVRPCNWFSIFCTFPVAVTT